MEVENCDQSLSYCALGGNEQNTVVTRTGRSGFIIAPRYLLILLVNNFVRNQWLVVTLFDVGELG